MDTPYTYAIKKNRSYQITTKMKMKMYLCVIIIIIYTSSILFNLLIMY
jgi:hypothetical protein